MNTNYLLSVATGWSEKFSWIGFILQKDAYGDAAGTLVKLFAGTNIEVTTTQRKITIKNTDSGAFRTDNKVTLIKLG